MADSLLRLGKLPLRQCVFYKTLCSCESLSGTKLRRWLLCRESCSPPPRCNTTALHRLQLPSKSSRAEYEVASKYQAIYRACKKQSQSSQDCVHSIYATSLALDFRHPHRRREMKPLQKTVLPFTKSYQLLLWSFHRRSS